MLKSINEYIRVTVKLKEAITPILLLELKKYGKYLDIKFTS